MNQFQEKQSKGFFHSMLLNTYCVFKTNIIDSQILTSVAYILYFLHMLGYSSSIFDQERNEDGIITAKLKTSVTGSYRYLFHFVQPIRFLSSFHNQTIDIIILLIMFTMIFGQFIYMSYITLSNIMAQNGVASVSPLRKLISVFTLYFNTVFYLPITEILITFMAHGCISLSEDCTHSNNIFKILGYFLFIFTLLLSVLYSQLVEKSLGFREIGTQKIKTTSIQQFMNQIRILYPVFLQFLEEDYAKICIFIMHWIMFVSIGVEFYSVIPFTKKKTSKLYLGGWSFGLIFSILQPLVIFEYIEEEEMICLTLLISLFVYKIALIYYDRIWYSIMFEMIDASDTASIRDREWNFLSHKIGFLEDIMEDLKWDSGINIQFVTMISQHLEVCTKITCQCQKFKRSRNLAIPLNDGQIYVDHSLVAEIHMILIQKHFSQFTFFNKQENIPVYLRYMDYYQFQGKYTFTAGKITLLQSERNSGKIKMGIILDAQAEAILAEIKTLMIEKFYRNIESEKQEEGISAASFYLNVENNLLNNQDNIVKLLNTKLSITEQMIDGFSSTQEVLENARNYIKELDTIEPQLQSYHLEANYIKSLNLLVFFYNELKSDFRQAKRLVASRAQLKNKAKMPSENGILQAFSEEVSSLSISIGKDNGMIVNHSHKAPKFFGYSRYEFSMIKSIEELIPQTIAQVHNQLIQDFISTGITPLVERQYYLMSKDKKGFLIPIYLFLSYNYTYVDDFVFTGFFCHPSANEYDFEKEALMMVSEDGQIDGITNTLLKFAYLDNENFNVRILNNFKAQDLFPSFKQLKLDLDQKTKIEQDNIIFYFPNGKMEEKFSTVSIASKFLARMSLKIEGGGNSLDWTTYTCDLQLLKKEKFLSTGEVLTYYLVKLRNMKSVSHYYLDQLDEKKREAQQQADMQMYEVNSTNLQDQLSQQEENNNQNLLDIDDVPPSQRPEENQKSNRQPSSRRQHNETFNTNPNLDDSAYSQGTNIQDEEGVGDVQQLEDPNLPDWAKYGKGNTPNQTPGRTPGRDEEDQQLIDKGNELQKQIQQQQQNNDEGYEINNEDEVQKIKENSTNTHKSKSILKKKQQPEQIEEKQQNLNQMSPKKKNNQNTTQMSSRINKTHFKKYISSIRMQCNKKMKTLMEAAGLAQNKKKLKNNAGSTGNIVLDMGDINKNNMMVMEQSSVNSSAEGSQSLIHQKMDIFKDFMENKKKMRKLQLMYVFKILEFLLIFLAFFLQNVMVKNSFTFLENQFFKFQSYSNFMQPYAGFVNMIQQSANLNNEDILIDAATVNSYEQFYIKTFDELYTQFKEDLNEFQMEPSIQSAISQFVTLKSPFEATDHEFMLMSGQYLVTEHIQEVMLEDLKDMSIENPSNKFLQSNFQSFFNFFEEFRLEMLQDVKNFESDTQSEFTLLIVGIFLFNLIVFTVSGVNYHYYIEDLQNILNLMSGVPWEQAQIEKEYIIKTIKNIEEEPTWLFEYMDIDWNQDFFNDVMEKRRQISNQISQISQNTKKKGSKMSQIQINSQKINKGLFLVVLVICFITFIVPSIILVVENTLFFQKAQPAIYYLDSYTKTQTYIPTLNVYRFILVQRQYYIDNNIYYANEINAMQSGFSELLDHLLEFRKQIEVPTEIESIFSNEHKKSIDELISVNLCTDVYNIKSEDRNLCENVKFGILKLGFMPTLNEIYKDFRADIDREFSNIDTVDFESSIVGIYIQQILRQILANIMESTDQMISNISVINDQVSYSFFAGITIIYAVIFLKYFKHIELDYRASKKVILLFPAITILQEDTIYKKVKYYSDRYHIGN